MGLSATPWIPCCRRLSVSRQTQPALMQTPRGALAPEFRSSGRPTKWGDRQQHRSDWDDSPAAVRTLPSTLRKLQVSLATPGRGGRSWRAGLVPLACSSAVSVFSGGTGGGGADQRWPGGAMGKRPEPGSRPPLRPHGSQPHRCRPWSVDRGPGVVRRLVRGPRHQWSVRHGAGTS